jgi:hypothetical protein
MMRTLMWKEYREHRIIWLAMMVVNSGTLLGISGLDETGSLGPGSGPGSSKLSALGPIAVLLAWVYGMICGAMLLAGEREDATLSYLDALPVTRFRLWLTKAQIGLLLLGGQILVLCVWLAALRSAADSRLVLWPFMLAMMLFGGAGMAFGLLFSARGESVLHTIGMAIVGQAIAGFAAVLLAFTVDFALHEILIKWTDSRHLLPTMSQGDFEGILGAVIFGGLTLSALAGSARIFSRTDRLRRPAYVRRLSSRASMAASWGRLVWLCGRQMRRLATVVLVVSLGLGLLFLLSGPLLWPVATLFLGVLCGVTVFSDEQEIGAFRFLGEQRLPLGRIWLIKTGARFALLLLAAFVLFLPSLAVVANHYAEHPSHDHDGPPILSETLHLNLIGEVVPGMSYSLIWLLYGFSAGHLCGLLSRKSLVAVMIALMTSAGLAVVWVPSLAGIGLHFWQIAIPPLLLLAVAAFLVRAWAANRLATWRTYGSVGAAVVAVLLWIAAGLWYRIIEIPDVPEPFDVEAYKASLPPFEKNAAGQAIRGAWSRVEAVTRDMGTFGQSIKKSLYQQSEEVLKNGWPDGKLELGEWLDKTFAEDWLKPLVPLPDLPLGMVADPRLLDEDSKEIVKWFNANELSKILAVRGLQQQARGDPAVFVEYMRIALALSRNLQHYAPFIVADTGRAAANVWPEAVDQWLRKLHGRPDLLARALQILADHEQQQPGEEEQFRADYLIARNTLMGTPEKLVDMALRHHDDKEGKQREAELQAVAILWRFPWEQQRHRRLLRVLFAGSDGQVRRIEEWGGQAFASIRLFARAFQETRSIFQARALRHRTDFRACQLKVALRKYQADNGELPATLDALTPRYFHSLPRDPFLEEQTFGYRRSRGEWIVWPERGSSPEQTEFPIEIPVMPRADGPAAPAEQGWPQGPIAAGGGRAMPGAARAAAAGEIPPGGEVPFMPHADEPAFPPPEPREQRRYIPKGQAILWSVGEDGRDNGGRMQGIGISITAGADLIYIVPTREK